MGTQAFLLSSSSSGLYIVEQADANLVTASELDYEGLSVSHKRVPIGQDFQVELPSEILESPQLDAVKWLGEHIWPDCRESMVAEKSTGLKALYGLCTCANSGTVDCVRQHIDESRRALKIELGGAFYKWGFHEMGEVVAEGWTEAEQLLFHQAIQKNPSSFWGEVHRAFPLKDTRELVSYYFNVFILRKRAVQNRLYPNHVDSDDDMWLDCEDEQDMNAPEAGEGPSEGDNIPHNYLDDSEEELSSESHDDNHTCPSEENQSYLTTMEKLVEENVLTECIGHTTGKESECETREDRILGKADSSTGFNSENGGTSMMRCAAYSFSEPQASVTSFKKVEEVSKEN